MQQTADFISRHARKWHEAGRNLSDEHMARIREYVAEEREDVVIFLEECGMRYDPGRFAFTDAEIRQAYARSIDAFACGMDHEILRRDMEGYPEYECGMRITGDPDTCRDFIYLTQRKEGEAESEAGHGLIRFHVAWTALMMVEERVREITGQSYLEPLANIILDTDERDFAYSYVSHALESIEDYIRIGGSHETFHSFQDLVLDIMPEEDEPERPALSRNMEEGFHLAYHGSDIERQATLEEYMAAREMGIPLRIMGYSRLEVGDDNIIFLEPDTVEELALDSPVRLILQRQLELSCARHQARMEGYLQAVA